MARTQGFTMVEVLVAAAILSVLVSLAVPTFAGYKKQVLMSEATTQLNMMFKGQAALWTERKCRRVCYGPGTDYVLGEGGEIEYGFVVPDPSAPPAHAFSQNPGCERLNFEIAGPTRFAYAGFFIDPVSNRRLAGGCVGNTDPLAVTLGLTQDVSSGGRAYENSAFYRFSDDKIAEYTELINNGPNDQLYRAGREFRPDWDPSCSVGFAKRQGTLVWVLLGLLVAVRFRRRSSTTSVAPASVARRS